MTPEQRRQTLDGLYREIARLGGQIDAPRALLPSSLNETERTGYWLSIDFFEAGDGDEEDGWWLSLLTNEGRGQEVVTQCFVEFAEGLIEHLFEGVTHQMAMAQRRPAEGEDSRRSLFNIQEALLAQLNPDWAARTAKRHAEVLVHFPFKDERPSPS